MTRKTHIPELALSREATMAYTNFFNVGDKVEVTTEYLSLHGALFPAEVVKVIQWEKKLQVEFDLLKNKNTKGTIVREVVDESMVRPVPAEHKNCKFAFGDIVDAFYKGGWWEGTITEVLEDSKFTVFFRFAAIQVNFNASQLRHHQEWVNGAWVPTLNENGPPGGYGNHYKRTRYGTVTQAELWAAKEGLKLAHQQL